MDAQDEADRETEETLRKALDEAAAEQAGRERITGELEETRTGRQNLLKELLTEMEGLHQSFSRDSDRDISPYMTRLGEIKKNLLPVDADFSADADDESGVVTACLTKKDSQIAGVFCMKGKPCAARVSAPDGEYTDEITREKVEVRDGVFHSDGMPVIFKVR